MLHVFNFLNLFLFYLQGREKHRERQREGSTICWFALQMPTIVGAGPDKSQEQSTQSGSHQTGRCSPATWAGRVTSVCESSPTVTQDTYNKATRTGSGANTWAQTLWYGKQLSKHSKCPPSMCSYTIIKNHFYLVKGKQKKIRSYGSSKGCCWWYRKRGTERHTTYYIILPCKLDWGINFRDRIDIICIFKTE